MSWARQVVGRSRSPAPRRLADQRRPEGGRRRAPAARRWRWVASVLVAGVVLAGCEAPRPDVTFFGNRTAVQTGPTRWCEVDEAALTVACTQAGVEDVSRLSLRPGQQVQI